MQIGNDDVIRNIPLYGLRSPYNKHSFRSVSILLPTTCVMCKSAMFMWTEVVCCVTCSNYCHRSCMRSTAAYCEHYADKKRRLMAETALSTRLSFRRSISVQPSDKCIWRYKLKQLATRSVFHVGKVDLSINEVDVLIDSYVPANAHRVDHSMANLSRRLSAGNGLLNGIDVVIAGLFLDVKSFPHKVLTTFYPELVKIIMSAKYLLPSEITFPVPQQNSQVVLQCETILKHSRQCLDAIALSIIACLHDKEDDISGQFIMAIVNSCDAFVMVTYKEGKLYDLLIDTCKNACRYDDVLLSRRFEELSIGLGQVSGQGMHPLSSHEIELVGKLMSLFEKNPGLTKLRAVVAVLRCLSKPVEQQRTHNVNNESQHLLSGDAMESDRSENSSELSRKEHSSESEEGIGADVLLELLTRALVLHHTIMTSPAPIADNASDRVVAVVSSPVADVVPWNALCMFMSTLTAEVPFTLQKRASISDFVDAYSSTSEGGWTVGMEGYALASLQTAIFTLLQ